MKSIKTSLSSILMIDNEEYGNVFLKNIFQEKGLYLEIQSQYNDYMHTIESKNIDCIMLNSDLINNLTIDIIDKVKCNFPWMVIVILLKNPSYERIFQFVRLGVDDFIIKPFIFEDIEKVLTYYYF